MAARIGPVAGALLFALAAEAQDSVPPAVAAERLLKQLELEPQRHDAMHGLWQLGKDAVPALTRALKDPRLEVVQAACAVLHEIGPAGAEARHHLEKLLPKADKRTAEALRWALHGVTSETFAVALWDKGEVKILDAAGKVVRTQGGFHHTWDVQALPDGQLLVTEASPGKVRVFDADGEELWSTEAELSQPLRAQRLCNGHTVVADGRAGVVEFGPDGKVVWRHDGTSPACVQRLLNGHTIYVDQKTNQLVELDRVGKEVTAFAIPQNVFGAQRLPNGHTLLCVRGGNKLLEIDAKGETVSETDTVGSPNDCLRLPDGRTIVAGGSEVALFDADGKKLWSHEGKWVGGVSR